MEKDFMLTTIDNPYNPFENFSQWLLYDNEQNYNTCGKIARLAKITADMSEAEIEAEVSKAIETLIEYDFYGIYKRVSPKDYDEHSDS